MPDPDLPKCAELVKKPIDAPPTRSPRAVHSAVAHLLRGKDVVEIGTRNGDGMACFSQFARSAVAVEQDRAYCGFLERRAARLRANGRRSFRVGCNAYQNCTPDADVYTWWQDSVALGDELLLAHLREQQVRGRIRASAHALVLFDQGWSPDQNSWRSIGRLAAHRTVVDYDERPLCLKLKYNYGVCQKRAHGAFTVGMIPIASIPFSLEQAWAEQPLRWRGKPRAASFREALGQVLATPHDDTRRCAIR